ncbi:MAG: Transglycosylase associated protein, partial [Chloroflexota bacterium]|nr:Transglycosylase associated protein [Chloroflexota bacterium]
VGILGAIVGGWLARELGYSQVEGFIGAIVFAVLGSIVVRLILRAIEGGR